MARTDCGPISTSGSLTPECLRDIGTNEVTAGGGLTQRRTP
jgi:hypothetical protein